MTVTKKKFKVRKNDQVVVIAGKDRGKKGKVIKIVTETNRVLVAGINVAKKHVKPSQFFPQGGIVSKEMPIHISNIALVDPKTEMATRVGFKTLEDGKKVRFAKKSKEIIENLEA
jgi:large subunit ribosomal protein L24